MTGAIFYMFFFFNICFIDFLTHKKINEYFNFTQVTAASINSPRCRDALSSAVSKLQGSADTLQGSCQQQSSQLQQHCAEVKHAHSKLSDSLAKLASVCEMGDGGKYK